MEYLYNMKKANNVVDYAFYLIMDELKVWLTKYDIPDMDVKLLIGTGSVNKISDNGKNVLKRVCAFDLVKNDDVDNRYPIITMMIYKILTEDPRWHLVIHLDNNHETIITQVLDVEDEGFISIRTIVTDDHNDIIKESDRSNDCKQILDIVKKCFHGFLDHCLMNYLDNKHLDEDEDEEE